MRLYALHSCIGALETLIEIQGCVEANKPQKLTTADWKIFNYCATISRAYAIFEEFVKQIASEHSIWMAKHCDYDVFLKNRKKHLKEGFLYISQNNSHPKYKNTPHEDWLEAYYKLICKNDTDSFNPELLLHHTANMRLSVIEQIYNRFGCKSIGDWINSNSKLKDYLREEFDKRTPDKFLEYFIELRNGAAHASVVSIESPSNLIKICTALDLICSSIDDFLASQRLEVQISKKKAEYLGTVDNSFPNRRVVSITGARVNPASGDTLCFISYGSACKIDTILEVEKHSVNNTTVHTLKLSSTYKKGMDIFILKFRTTD